MNRLACTYHFWALVYALLVGYTHLAQAHTHGVPRFERYTQAGLAQESINKVLQDRYGFLWLASHRGLERYDGYRFHAYRHDPYDPTSLSSGEVTHLVETAEGDLWLVAGGILNRYNRATNTFSKVTSGEGGVSGEVSVLYNDRGNRLWVGTVSDGLYRHDPETGGFTQFVHNDRNRNSLAGNSISGIYQAKNGSLWIATRSGGLSRYHGTQGQFDNFLEPDMESYTQGLELGKHHISPTIDNTSILEDGEGKLWVITYGGGLLHLNPKDGNYKAYTHNPSNRHGISHNIIFAQFRDRLGRIWLATAAGGLDLFHPDTEYFVHFTPQGARGMGLEEYAYQNAIFTQDLHGDIWIGARHGLTVFCPSDERFYHHRRESQDIGTLSDNQISALFIDQAGCLWVGTRFGGLNTYSYYKNKFSSYRATHKGLMPIGDVFIDALLETPAGQLWLGTREEGLVLYDPFEDHILARYRHQPGEKGPPGKHVSSLLYADEDLWVGTSDGGLARLSEDSSRWSMYPRRANDPRALHNQNIHVLYRDPLKRIWAGTGEGGLHRYRPQSNDFDDFSIREEEGKARSAVSSLLSDGSEHLWVGTDGDGLHRITLVTKETQVFRRDGNGNGLSHDHISSLVHDLHGNLWVGTLGGGLNRYMGQHQGFTHFTRKSGVIPGNMIYTMKRGSGNKLWLLTDEGLVSFDTDAWTSRVYGQGDGLVEGSLAPGALALAQDPFLLYGGRGDLNRFDPESLRQNPHPPPIAVSTYDTQDLKDVALLMDQKLELPFSQNRFSASFTALDFTYPAKNTYAYKLEGEDASWHYCDDVRFANYTSLDPGSYRFRVKGANSDGVWNNEGASIELEILPPFWQTWWFYALEVLLALLLIFAALRFQWRRLQRQKQEALVELDLQRKTQELDFARRVQLSMLPEKHMDTGNLTIVGKMRTATEVGGDYYDYFHLTDHHVCFLLGDATGHGLAAGLAVGMTKMGAAVWSMGGNVDLEEMMRELNLGLKAALKERTMGMALGAGIIDLRTLEVSLTFAGMPFPYHYRAKTQRLKTLVMKSPPLGFMRKVTVRTQTLTLEEGDYLVLISDGLPERFNPENHLWGSGALERRLRRICGAQHSARDVCRHLFDACDIFADGRRNEDDMTILVLQTQTQPVEGQPPKSKSEKRKKP